MATRTTIQLYRRARKVVLKQPGKRQKIIKASLQTINELGELLASYDRWQLMRLSFRSCSETWEKQTEGG